VIDSAPLPLAVKADRKALPAEVLNEIMALNGARPVAFTITLLGAWLVIACAVGVAIYLHSAWATIVAIFIVATRQNVLGLLVHEQAHLLGYRGRYGDLVVNLFAAYPLLVLTVEDYAQVHLAHHRDYFQPEDPDFARKSGEEWSFPKSRGELARLLLTDLVGLNLLKLVRGKRSSSKDVAFVRRYRIPRGLRPAYLLAIAGLLTYIGGWTVFLLYWALPLLTVTQVLVRWGAICEHKYNLPNASVAVSTPLILLSRWERLLLPNLNFAMHPYHHYFPGIAFTRLPHVHEIYCREGLVNHENTFHGYAAYFKTLIRREEPAVSSS
jgi:fatty acid desaturase